jgi:hypothetical protein
MFAFLGCGFAPPALPPEADVRLLAAFAQHWGAIGEARAAGDPKKAKALLDSFMQAQNVASKRDLLHPLRLALTGEEKGVSLYLVLALLTPQAVESRIQSSLGR